MRRWIKGQCQYGLQVTPGDLKTRQLESGSTPVLALPHSRQGKKETMCRSATERGGPRRCPGNKKSKTGSAPISSSSAPEVTPIVWGAGDGKYHAEDAPQIPDRARLGLQNWENRDGYRVNITRYEHKGQKYEIMHRYGPAEPEKEAEDVSSIADSPKWASDYDRPVTPKVDQFLEENADKGPWPGPPPKKGAKRAPKDVADMGTKTNPWPIPPWSMSGHQKADHDYEQPLGVGIDDTKQAVKGWVKDKLAGRS